MNKTERLQEKFFNESSLSRLKSHIEKYDCGTITAFRSFVFETDKPYELDQSLIDEYNRGDDETRVQLIDSHTVTRKQNLIRNTALKADLSAKYDVTVVQGKYVENYGTPLAKEVGEVVFFVVDSQNRGTLKQDLQDLGKKYFQDSIMFIPKGGASSELIGTSPINQDLKMGSSITFDKSVFGKSGQFMTKINGRPFVFESEDLHVITTHLNKSSMKTGVSGQLINSMVSKQSWKEENTCFEITDYKEIFKDKFIDV